MIDGYLSFNKTQFDRHFFPVLLCLKIVFAMAKKERELPEILELDFTITDESVNRYG